MEYLFQRSPANFARALCRIPEWDHRDGQESLWDSRELPDSVGIFLRTDRAGCWDRGQALGVKREKKVLHGEKSAALILHVFWLADERRSPRAHRR